MKQVFFLIIVCTLLCSCTQKVTFKIFDPSKVTEIQFKPKKRNNHTLVINLSGEINGDAKIIISSNPLKNDIYYETLLNKGEIKNNLRYDWYEESGTLKFQPINCNKGSIKVILKFYN